MATTHTVKAGESFASIAGQHYGNQRWLIELASANGMGINDIIHPGMVLQIPDFDLTQTPVITNEQWYGKPGESQGVLTGFQNGQPQYRGLPQVPQIGGPRVPAIVGRQKGGKYRPGDIRSTGPIINYYQPGSPQYRGTSLPTGGGYNPYAGIPGYETARPPGPGTNHQRRSGVKPRANWTTNALTGALSAGGGVPGRLGGAIAAGGFASGRLAGSIGAGGGSISNPGAIAATLGPGGTLLANAAANRARGRSMLPPGPQSPLQQASDALAGGLQGASDALAGTLNQAAQQLQTGAAAAAVGPLGTFGRALGLVGGAATSAYGHPPGIGSVLAGAAGPAANPSTLAGAAAAARGGSPSIQGGMGRQTGTGTKTDGGTQTQTGAGGPGQPQPTAGQGLTGPLTYGQLADAARWTGLAFYAYGGGYGKTDRYGHPLAGNRNTLPLRVSMRVAQELPWRGAGFGSVEEFMQAYGYAVDADGNWTRMDPKVVRPGGGYGGGGGQSYVSNYGGYGGYGGGGLTRGQGYDGLGLTQWRISG